MFAWFKKNAVVEKVDVGSNFSSAQRGSDVTSLAMIESETLKNEGNVYFDHGRLTDAEACYRRALSLHPTYAEAYTNLGRVAYARRNFDEAIALYRTAIEFKPTLLPAHLNLSAALIDQGKTDEAKEILQQIVTLDPEHAAAWFNLGAISLLLENYALAESQLRRGLALQPDGVDGHINLGTIYIHAKRWLEAEAACSRALALQPDSINAHFSMGTVFMNSKRLHEAEAAYTRVLDLQADRIDANLNIGVVFLKTGRLHQAEIAFRKSIALQPDSALIYTNIGTLFLDTGRFHQAETALLRALGIQPDYADANLNIGLVFLKTGRLHQAEIAFRKSIALQPDSALGYTNTGALFLDTGRLPQAETALLRALGIQPDYTDAIYNFSIFLLSAGRYAEAWPHFESRYDPRMSASTVKPMFLPFPQWQGESLMGKSIVIMPEQGYGDHIQFCRYVKSLRERGVVRITLACHSALKPLLETLDGVDAVIHELSPDMMYDYWVFALSLPLRFGTTLYTIPGNEAYLSALPGRAGRWQRRLETENLKIGLVWKGNPEHKNDANRSLPGLATLAPLWSVPGLSFISLQMGAAEEEAEAPPFAQPILALGKDIADFADTAAIVDQLDLVICVDTAVAHLAGALGKPCWVMLPAVGADWRWMREREDSPWYESVRLFRQKVAGDWSAVVEQLRQELVVLANAAS